jgi:hypothetical protein
VIKPEIEKRVLVLCNDDPEWTVGWWTGREWWVATFQTGGESYTDANILEWRDLPKTEEAV